MGPGDCVKDVWSDYRACHRHIIFQSWHISRSGVIGEPLAADITPGLGLASPNRPVRALDRGRGQSLGRHYPDD
jgi:hypothetical protein